MTILSTTNSDLSCRFRGVFRGMSNTADFSDIFGEVSWYVSLSAFFDARSFVIDPPRSEIETVVYATSR